tara:strand:+ start:329 stop:490 length:162 start_codon:yes stop_codon:yes gene_type:complete
MYLINVRRQGVETARKFLDRIEARGVVDGVVEDERAAMLCFLSLFKVFMLHTS